MSDAVSSTIRGPSTQEIQHTIRTTALTQIPRTLVSFESRLLGTRAGVAD